MKKTNANFKKLVKARDALDEANEAIAVEMARLMVNMVNAKVLDRARDEAFSRDLARQLADDPDQGITFTYSIYMNHGAILAAIGPEFKPKPKPKKAKAKGDAKK